MNKSQYLLARQIVQFIIASDFDTLEELRDYIAFLKKGTIAGCDELSDEAFKAVMRSAYEYAPLALDKTNLINILHLEMAIRDCIIAFSTNEQTTKDIPPKKSALKVKKVPKPPSEASMEDDPDYGALLDSL